MPLRGVDLFEFLKFENKKESERNKKRYFKRIYPYGQAQKDLEDSLLNKNFNKDVDLIRYALISLKDEVEKAKDFAADEIRDDNLYEDDNVVDKKISEYLELKYEELFNIAIEKWSDILVVKHMDESVKKFIVELVKFENTIKDISDFDNFEANITG